MPKPPQARPLSLSRVHTHQPICVSVPGIQAVRVSSDEPYFGMKDTFLISRFESGRSEFWTHGRTWAGAPGSVIVFAPGDVHRDVKREGMITYQLIRFVDPPLEALCVQSCFAANDERAMPFQRLHDAVAAQADRFTLECAVAEAVAAMTPQAEPRFEAKRSVRRALAMMRERLADALTLDDLAQYAGLDKFHLCRTFREQMGMPPHAYLTQLRIMHAKELLAAGTKPKDIAAQVGLYDQSQLNRHFRRIVGMTPGQYSAKNTQFASAAAR